MLSSCALHSINVCGKTTSVELIVKLHKVVHMPNAIACLISMSKLLLLGYKVNEDISGISLIGKGNQSLVWPKS